jgi:hypothetical protein
MKVVEAEHILGGERIVFYFMAEGRIDFRELVRRLSHEFQTRIEMRQIGARDEAKLLGDVESCGQEICCRRYLKYLKPVNMRMAKMQKATLDPAKISGYCGRLKCCLRYEDETYAALKKKLPRKNVMVRTPKGEGRVVDTQIITQLVMVEYDRNEREAVAVDDIQVLGPAPRRPRPEERESGEKGAERRRPGRGSGGDRAARKDRPEAAESDAASSTPAASEREDRTSTEDRGEGRSDTKKRRRRRGRGTGRKNTRNQAGADRGSSKPRSETPAGKPPEAASDGSPPSNPVIQPDTKPEPTENHDT